MAATCSPHLPVSLPPQVLSGHEGPISGLCFNPMKSILASASWDKTVRLWDMFDSWRTKETLTLTSDGEPTSRAPARTCCPSPPCACLEPSAGWEWCPSQAECPGSHAALGCFP